MSTIKDVASAAGVSITTASRALNNYSDVAAATRARILAAAEQLGYHPNHTARSLQGTRTQTIGLVIPQLVHRQLDSFWLEFISGVSAACGEADYDLLLNTARDLLAERAHYARMVRSGRVDGVILCDVRVRDARVSFLQEEEARFVAFGRTLGSDDYSWIDVDGAAGVREAVEHLLTLGHRRIAFLGTPREYSFSHFRHEGYLQALLHAGLPYDEQLVQEDLDAGTPVGSVLERLLALSRPPTALIACADFIATNVMRDLRRLGVQVPADLSVVAFDDSVLTQREEPPLTNIDQDVHALGARAARLLIRELRGETQRSRELVRPRLVVRGSTAPPPAQALALDGLEDAGGR
jgi:LacI family transcriptional regulator